MTNPMPRTLTQMQRRPTSYEVVVTANGETQRLAFTQRQTKANLLSICQANGDLVVSLMGDWDGDAQYSSTTGWTFGPARVHYSGKTEREIASEQGLIA